MNEEIELTAEEIAKNFGLESNDDFMTALSELLEDQFCTKLACSSLVTIVARGDKKINDTLEPIIQDFKEETRKILNLFDKVCYTFNNEEEKNELIKKFEKAVEKKNSSKYAEYIYMNYEIDDKFFIVDCYVINKGLFVIEQRNKIAQSITIEL